MCAAELIRRLEKAGWVLKNQKGSQMVTELRAVLADQELVMGDGERMGRVLRLEEGVLQLLLVAGRFEASTELLVAGRSAGAGQ
jgi:hypothetical protein